MTKSIKKDNDISNLGESNPALKIAKIGMWQAIAVAIITTVGGGIIGYISGYNKQESSSQKEKPVLVVPIQNTNMVKELPIESNSDLYELI